MQHDRMAPAWLISGESGVGQWPMAIWLAAFVNCRKETAAAADMFAPVESPTTSPESDTLPCGICVSCKQIASLNHPSLVTCLPISSTKNQEEFTEAQTEALTQRRNDPFALREHSKFISISIDAIRAVRKRLSMQASPDGIRVVILDELEKSKSEAIDALLKLIEEPPDRTMFVITTSSPRAIRATIHSRVRRISLRPVSDVFIQSYLSSHRVTDEKELQSIIRWSRGSLGLAGTLIDADEQSSAARDLAEFLIAQCFERDQGRAYAALSQSFPEFTGPESSRQMAVLFLRFLQIELDFQLQRFGDTSSENTSAGNRLAASLRSPWRARRLATLLENTLDDIRRNVHIRTMIFSFYAQWRTILTQHAERHDALAPQPSRAAYGRHS